MTAAVLLMALCGGLGAVSRFVLDGELRARLGGGLPVVTLMINLAGSLLLGLVVARVGAGAWGSEVKLLVGTGFCGGFTTFSTASLEAVRLLEDKRFGAGLAYLLVTALGCVAAAWLGLVLG